MKRRPQRKSLAAFEQAFRARGNVAFGIFLFLYARNGDNVVAVENDSGRAAQPRDDLASLSGVFKFVYGAVFLKNDLAFGAGVDLEGVAVTDNVDTKNLAFAIFYNIDKLSG